MNTLARGIWFFGILLVLGGTRPALADTYVSMPASKATNKLKVRFVRYDGSTNGQMVIDVKNTGKRAETFSADGMFFVPDGDPEKAPQRLGAAGPFQEVKGKAATAHRQAVSVRPGEIKRLHLEVFCIDSHRGSPSTSTQFSIAKKKLPKKLREKITTGTKAILYRNKGDVKKSKSAIQSHMWETRDADWIKLEGERAREKSAPAPRQQRRPRRKSR